MASPSESINQPLRSAPSIVVSGEGFSGWHALNDTVMGGRSSGNCSVGLQGLRFDGEVVEEGGGFVSVRSPLFPHPWTSPSPMDWRSSCWARVVASSWLWLVLTGWQV